MPHIVLYHGGCMDGFCAAWVLSKKYPDASFLPVFHGDPPPSGLDGMDVIIVDFSYKRDVLESLRSCVGSMLVLDHHKTAEEELAGLEYCKFDMEKSGARLAADFVGFSHWIVDYVEDRDLWRHKLPCSRQVNAALAAYPHNFEVWCMLAKRSIVSLIEEGGAILRAQDRVVDALVRNAEATVFDGLQCLAVNSPVYQSEVAGRLAEAAPIGACYTVSRGKRRWSLRSRGDVDVGEVAKRRGGGGHKHSAGFEEPVLDFRSYQQQARSTAVYKPEHAIMYPTVGLAGEVGEVCEKVKKLFRDKDGAVDDAFREGIVKELGDVQWYLSDLAFSLGVCLQDVAERNIRKLADRKSRGVLHGNGDSR